MKKALTLLMALCLLLSCLAGCGSGTTTSEPDAAPDTPAADSKEPVDAADEPSGETPDAAQPDTEPAAVSYPLSENPAHYSVMANGRILASAPGLEDINNCLAVKAVSELTNVFIDWEVPADTAMQQQVSLMLVSEDYTDGLIYYPGMMGSSLDYLIEENILLDLKDEIYANCPNYLGILEGDENVMRGVMTDGDHMGAMYKITDRRPECYGGFYVTTAVLEEAGFSASNLPVTYDDFEALLAAGKDDASNAPLYLDGTARLMLAAGYDVNTGFVHNGDNRLFFGPTSQNYKDWLTMMAGWAEKGYLDKDFASRNIFFFDSGLLLSGDVVVMPGVFSFSTMYTNQGLAVQPIPYPVKDAANPTRYLAAGTNDERINQDSLMVFTACKNPTLLLQFFDYGYSDEGSITTNFGVLGESYDLDENGTPALRPLPEGQTEQFVNYGSMLPMLSLTWREYTGEPELATLSRQIWEANWSMENHKAFGTLTAGESEATAGKLNDINTYVEEYTFGVISGTRSLDEWDEYVAYIEHRGLAEVTAAYQAAHDRYLAR